MPSRKFNSAKQVLRQKWGGDSGIANLRLLRPARDPWVVRRGWQGGGGWGKSTTRAWSSSPGGASRGQLLLQNLHSFLSHVPLHHLPPSLNPQILLLPLLMMKRAQAGSPAAACINCIHNFQSIFVQCPPRLPAVLSSKMSADDPSLVFQLLSHLSCFWLLCLLLELLCVSYLWADAKNGGSIGGETMKPS